MKNFAKEMKIKVIDIDADKLVAILNIKDAKEFGLFPIDRVEIFCPRTKRKTVCVVDTTKSMFSDGTIGIFQDVEQLLKVKQGDKVRVQAVPAPESVHYIKKKLDGQSLSENEINAIVKDLHENKLSEIEAAGFVSAVYIHGFDLGETVAMTRALADNGMQLKFKKGPVVDKHCIGGTNGRTTMIIVPILASAGYLIPKTSSRSITSAAGTADSMEVLANVSLSSKRIVQITEKIGGVIAWGGALDLAPVDDKIIKIEHPFALDPTGQIIASVMAKKVSAGAKYVVVDMPIGPDVKIQSLEKAEDMARKFIAVGKRMGIKVEAVTTNGLEPSGNAFGPALEAKLVLEILEGKKFDNLALKSCELAGVLLEMVGKAKKGKGTAMARKILESGRALEKMKQIITAQGKKALKSTEIERAEFVNIVRAKSGGEISKINVKMCARVARAAGAPADKKAGLLLKVEVGDNVKAGQELFEIHAENKRKLAVAIEVSEKKGIIDLEKIILKKYS